MNNGKELLKKWQKKLGLTDWLIDLRDNCLPGDFVLENVSGECEYNLTHKSAIIRIINPTCYGDRLIPFNYEKTLVHELLHIKFGLIDNTDNQIHDTIVHQLIEEFARLLTDKGRN